jgi:hypothetical protein
MHIPARTVLVKHRLFPHAGDISGQVGWWLVDRVTQNWLAQLTPERLRPDPLNRSEEQQQQDLDDFVELDLRLGVRQIESRAFVFGDSLGAERVNGDIVLHLHTTGYLPGRAYIAGKDPENFLDLYCRVLDLFSAVPRSLLCRLTTRHDCPEGRIPKLPMTELYGQKVIPRAKVEADAPSMTAATGDPRGGQAPAAAQLAAGSVDHAPEEYYADYDDEVVVVECKEADTASAAAKQRAPKPKRQKDASQPPGNAPCDFEMWTARMQSVRTALEQTALRCIHGAFPSAELTPRATELLFGVVNSKGNVWREQRTNGDLERIVSLSITKNGGIHADLMTKVLNELCAPNGLKVDRNLEKAELPVRSTGIICLTDGTLQKIKRTDDGFFTVGASAQLLPIGATIPMRIIKPTAHAEDGTTPTRRGSSTGARHSADVSRATAHWAPANSHQ